MEVLILVRYYRRIFRCWKWGKSEGSWPTQMLRQFISKWVYVLVIDTQDQLAAKALEELHDPAE